jgi:Uma2 family endonuclease
MTVATITRRPPLQPKWIPKRLGRLTVEQYEAMVNSDVFTEHDNFVLINGFLVTKVTKKPPHVIAGELIRDELIALVPRNEWRVMVEAPVRIPDYNEPEPDVSLARGKATHFANRHPGPADLALVVEVSKSSLTEDRQMANIYGTAGIPIYWIVNLKAQQVEVYTLLKRQGTPGYGKPRIFKSGQSVPVIVEGQEVGRIAVVDVLPPPERTSTGNGV